VTIGFLLAPLVVASAQPIPAAAGLAVVPAAATLAAATATVEVAQSRVDVAQAAVGDYAARAYQDSAAADVSVLLGVTGPGDFVAGLGYLDQLARRRQAVLEALTLARVDQRNQENVAVGRRQAARDAASSAATALRESAQAELAEGRASRRATRTSRRSMSRSANRCGRGRSSAGSEPRAPRPETICFSRCGSTGCRSTRCRGYRPVCAEGHASEE
jgi:hypothetical protein